MRTSIAAVTALAGSLLLVPLMQGPTQAGAPDLKSAVGTTHNGAITLIREGGGGGGGGVAVGGGGHGGGGAVVGGGGKMGGGEGVGGRMGGRDLSDGGRSFSEFRSDRGPRFGGREGGRFAGDRDRDDRDFHF
jgi:hypothetical protein